MLARYYTGPWLMFLTQAVLFVWGDITLKTRRDMFSVCQMCPWLFYIWLNIVASIEVKIMEIKIRFYDCLQNGHWYSNFNSVTNVYKCACCRACCGCETNCNVLALNWSCAFYVTDWALAWGSRPLFVVTSRALPSSRGPEIQTSCQSRWSLLVATFRQFEPSRV